MANEEEVDEVDKADKANDEEVDALSLSLPLSQCGADYELTPLLPPPIFFSQHGAEPAPGC